MPYSISGSNIPHLAMEGLTRGQNQAIRRRELADIMARHRDDVELRNRALGLEGERFAEHKRRTAQVETEEFLERNPYGVSPQEGGGVPGPYQAFPKIEHTGRGGRPQVVTRPQPSQVVGPEQFAVMVEARRRAGDPDPEGSATNFMEARRRQNLEARRQQLADTAAEQDPRYGQLEEMRRARTEARAGREQAGRGLKLSEVSQAYDRLNNRKTELLKIAGNFDTTPETKAAANAEIRRLEVEMRALSAEVRPDFPALGSALDVNDELERIIAEAAAEKAEREARATMPGTADIDWGKLPEYLEEKFPNVAPVAKFLGRGAMGTFELLNPWKTQKTESGKPVPYKKEPKPKGVPVEPQGQGQPPPQPQPYRPQPQAQVDPLEEPTNQLVAMFPDASDDEIAMMLLQHGIV